MSSSSGCNKLAGLKNVSMSKAVLQKKRQVKISNMSFDQKFSGPPEVGVLRWCRNKNTPMDIATLRLNRPRCRFSENAIGGAIIKGTF